MLIPYSLRKVLDIADGTTVPNKVLTLDSPLESNTDPCAGFTPTSNQKEMLINLYHMQIYVFKQFTVSNILFSGVIQQML